MKTSKRKKQQEMEVIPKNPPMIPDRGLDIKMSALRKCDSCGAREHCTYYMEGELCSISNVPKNVTPEDLLSSFRDMLALNQERISHAIYVERMSGEDLNKGITKELKNQAMLIKTYHDLVTPRGDELKIEAKSSSPGIIDRLFGNFMKGQGGVSGDQGKA